MNVSVESTAGARAGATLLCLLCGLPSPVMADEHVALGGEFQVATSAGNGTYNPAVSVDADGDFVVVWISGTSMGTDSSAESIQGQRYASNGNPVGGEFQVNTYTTGRQLSPHVSSDDDGNFVVVWVNYDPGGSTYEIQGQRFSSGGALLGSEFQVNTYTTDRQNVPRVAVDSDGDFVVVWMSEGSSGTDSSGQSVQGQRYSSGGTALGSEFQVNTYTTDHQFFPFVSAEPEGGFVVVWESLRSNGTDPATRSIQGRRYDSAGIPLGDDFQVNSYTTGPQRFPSVSRAADGSFVVAWMSTGSSGTDSLAESVQARRYASDGTPAGDEFQVNTYTTAGQVLPSVSMDSDGDFVVVWMSEGSSGTDSSSYSVQGQLYSSAGVRLGGEFQVNTFTTGYQEFSSVSMEAGGDFVVAWDSGRTAVFGQRYARALFADGFESGGTSSWASSAP